MGTKHTGLKGEIGTKHILVLITSIKRTKPKLRSQSTIDMRTTVQTAMLSIPLHCLACPTASMPERGKPQRPHPCWLALQYM